MDIYLGWNNIEIVKQSSRYFSWLWIFKRTYKLWLVLIQIFHWFISKRFTVLTFGLKSVGMLHSIKFYWKLGRKTEWNWPFAVSCSISIFKISSATTWWILQIVRFTWADCQNTLWGLAGANRNNNATLYNNAKFKIIDCKAFGVIYLGGTEKTLKNTVNVKNWDSCKKRNQISGNDAFQGNRPLAPNFS